MFDYYCKCKKKVFKKKNYSYWENRKTTSDELDIINYILLEYKKINKKILHIGIGNSFLAKKLNFNNFVNGISISNEEINKANKLNLANYEVLLCDKYSKELKSNFKNKKFDLIVDSNLKSYSCCDKSFKIMFGNFVSLLKKGGIIITSRKGMKWTKRLSPKLTFSFKKFFYYKLKEKIGRNENILSIEECKNISQYYSLKLYFNDKVCLFKKI